jgi:hypothetical protein
MLQHVQAKSTASQSPERLTMQESNSITTRQIIRRFRHYKACNSANTRQACKGIRITAA